MSSRNKLYVTVTNGMRGYFPILCDDKSMEEGPISSGITCKTWSEAEQAAKDWAKAEGCRYE